MTGLAEFQFWTTTNPCPLCQGHGFGGRSGTDVSQCRGGYLATHPLAAWCSNVESPVPSPSGKTWRHVLRRPLRLNLESQQRSEGSSTRQSRARPHGMPREFRVAAVYRYGTWLPAGGTGGQQVEVVRFEAPADWVPGPGERDTRRKRFRPRCDGMPRENPLTWDWRWPCDWRWPYRLKDWREGIDQGLPAYWVEGEKDVENGYALTSGAVFTTAPGGVQGLRRMLDQPDYYVRPWFDGLQELLVVLDQDANGIGAEVVTILREHLPDLKLIPLRTAVDTEGADLSDHMAAGLTLEELEPWTPKT